MALAVRAYDELKLRIDSSDAGYRVFASSQEGDAQAEFELPFESLEVENFTLRMSRGRRGSRRVENSEIVRAKDFGKALFDALVRDDVRELYHRSLVHSEDEEDRGLRLSLALSAVPELMDVPWEFLYDDPNFLSLSVSTPVVRYLDLPTPRRPLQVEPPLRVLAMVSSPSDYDPLDVEHERQKVEQALANLIDRDLVELHWLEDATLRALRRLLMESEDFHVFHYVGHAEYDEQAGSGAIVLEDREGRGRSVPAWQFSQTLHDNRKSLRLAVLNGCEGSIVAPDDPFAGLATSIVQRGIPAVIAMQFAITDAAAIVFAEGFYEALAAGYPVDAALGAARMAILTDENDVEWATPVLFMRVPDGRIFDIEGDGREKAGLELELSPEPAVCSPGETVSWRLVARNPGGSELAEVTVHDGPGRRVAGPFVLAGHETRELSWSEPVERDLDQTVTVGGRAPDDSVVSAQATARVSVLEPARLELELRAVPPECVPGEAVSWRLTARNSGGSELAEFEAYDRTGKLVAGPLALPGHESRELCWEELVEHELHQTVNAGGRTRYGKFVSAEADARVTVRERPGGDGEIRGPDEPGGPKVPGDGGEPQPIWRKPAALGIGVVAVALAALVAYLLLSRGPDPPETLELGGGTDGITVGEGSVWVADRGDSFITRVNPTSMKEIGSVDVDPVPDSLAVQHNRGEVWVTIMRENRVDRIDPDGEEVVQRVPVGENPEGVVIGHGAVWVANKGSNSVTRIDSEGGKTSAQVGTEPIHLAVAEDNVWVTVSGDGVLRELDAQTAEPTGREVPVPGAPRGLAFAEGMLWVAASQADHVAVVDPSEERIVDRIDVGANPREVRAGEGGLWVTSADGGVVSKIDASSRTVEATVEVEGHPYGLAVGEGFVWATSVDAGLLTRIDPDSL